MEGIKRVLLLSVRYAEDTDVFVREMRELDGAVLMRSSLKELDFTIINNRPKIFDRANNLDMAEYDLVILRNTHVLYSLDWFESVSLYLRNAGVRIVDDVEVSGAFLGKISQMFRFALAGLPVPDTVVSHTNLPEQLLQNDMADRFIFKANAGIKGKSNYLLTTAIEAEKIQAAAEDVFLAQRFVENDGDYRVLFIGKDIAPLIFKRMRGAESDSHTNNTSAGGRAEVVGVDDFDAEALEIARKLRKLIDKELIGIDLIQDKNSGRWYILEVNTTPALCSGAFGNEKKELFEKFLNLKMKEM